MPNPTIAVPVHHFEIYWVSDHNFQDIFDFVKDLIFGKNFKEPWSHQNRTYFKIGHKMSQGTPQDILSPNLT